MKLAIGIDVHKEKCAAYATYGGLSEPRQKQKDLIEGFNKDFRRFFSDARGMRNLSMALQGHEEHILIENSTKSHDVYWMLKGLGMNVIVAHSSDLRNITKSMRKNDDNDARELAHYMRRRLMGEVEFHESHIPDREVLMTRELCRSDLNDRAELTAVKLQIRSHLLIRGMELSKAYKDITCRSALKELTESKDMVLALDSKKAETLLQRIMFTEKMLRLRMMNNKLFDIIYSIPGFGVLTSSYVVCMADDFGRFEDGRSYAASVGLIPKQDESADKGKECGITRRGDPDLRRLLCQATFVHIFNADSFVSEKYRRLMAAGKKHNESLVACTNSMARLIFILQKEGRRFEADPKTLASARQYLLSEELENDMEELSLKK